MPTSTPPTMRRCDRCGARPHVQILTANGDVLLCGHHYNQHAPVLTRFALMPLSEKVAL